MCSNLLDATLELETFMSRSKMSVADAIESLRSELAKTYQNGLSKDLRFSVEAVELELEVIVSDNSQTNGGVNVLGFSLAAKGEADSSHAHRVKLSLRPIVSVKEAESPSGSKVSETKGSCVNILISTDGD